MTPLSLDMNSMELQAWISENGPVHVVFSKQVEDYLEGYAQEGTQALITKVDTSDEECAKWFLNYAPFEIENTLYESANYYGKANNSPGYLRAPAAGFYKAEDTVYMNGPDKLSVVLSVIQPASVLECRPDAVEQRFAKIQEALGGMAI